MQDGQLPDRDSDSLRELRADLDRLMQSSSVRDARDIVAGNPLLMGTAVADFLGEAVKRARQLGDAELARSCEVWLGLLRKFREFGLEEGTLELAIDELARARSAEDHRQVLRAYPELMGEAAQAYLVRRTRESGNVADVAGRGKYQLVRQLTQAADFSSPGSEEADTVQAVNAFVQAFVQQPDAAPGRRLLEASPDLLRPPLSVVVGAMFQPFVERARAMNELVKLRDLLLRQALFARCQEVGVEQAFEELAKGVKWHQLLKKN